MPQPKINMNDDDDGPYDWSDGCFVVALYVGAALTLAVCMLGLTTIVQQVFRWVRGT